MDENAWVTEFLAKLEAFVEKRSTDCPHCGKPAKHLEKVGRSVYVRPCGCRLWLGGIPEKWQRYKPPLPPPPDSLPY